MGESSCTRDRTRVPCIGRLILSHWAPRSPPPASLFLSKNAFCFLLRFFPCSPLCRNLQSGPSFTTLASIRMQKVKKSLLWCQILGLTYYFFKEGIAEEMCFCEITRKPNPSKIMSRERKYRVTSELESLIMVVYAHNDLAC